MRLLHHVLVLAAGALLAAVVAWVIGWLAAIAITPSTLKAIFASKVLTAVVFGFALNTLPAAALSFVAGAILASAVSLPRGHFVALAAAPWLIFATIGSAWMLPSEMPIEARLRPLLSLEVWRTVLAVPVGLWLATLLVWGKSNDPPASHAA